MCEPQAARAATSAGSFNTLPRWRASSCAILVNTPAPAIAPLSFLLLPSLYTARLSVQTHALPRPLRQALLPPRPSLTSSPPPRRVNLGPACLSPARSSKIQLHSSSPQKALRSSSDPVSLLSLRPNCAPGIPNPSLHPLDRCCFALALCIPPSAASQQSQHTTS